MTENGARHWRDWIRRDISRVQPLGGYAAKRCPVRTQLDVLRPGDHAGVSDFLRSLADAGNDFEEAVFEALHDDLDMLPIDLADRDRVEAQTLEAMRSGAPVITGGRLPTDLEGRRVGEPDILVRIGDAPVDGRWRYAPVDVKSHATLRPGKGADVVVQDMAHLAVPNDDADTTNDGRRDGSSRGDLLQLAHYHRMLEACGHVTDGQPWGAIVGTEQQAVWYRLDQPMWRTPTSDPELTSRTRNSLDVYDFEFGFRLDIASAALDHAADPSLPLLVDPIDNSECPECPWRNHCWPQLEAAGDVSLLPGVTYTDWRALGEADLATIDALAATDLAEVDGIKNSKFAELRVQAQARLSDQPVILRPGLRGEVPRADVEVDVDMENVREGAYLWGATVTVNGNVEGVEAGHRSFATWADPLDDDALGECFREFWSWLSSLRATCDEQGASFVAFCWSQAAENRYLRHGGELLDRSGEVEDFIASHQWVDLLAWFKDQYATGRGNGLKTVASLLGFQWRDDDPGGAASMTWYLDAMSDDREVAADARTRLLAYNEDDCRATAAIRAALT